jgi:hypothetical protein
MARRPTSWYVTRQFRLDVLAVCVHELEGVVAKRRTGSYVPGERNWVKTNREDWRWAIERESAISKTPRADVRLAIGIGVVDACLAPG